MRIAKDPTTLYILNTSTMQYTIDGETQHSKWWGTEHDFFTSGCDIWQFII